MDKNSILSDVGGVDVFADVQTGIADRQDAANSDLLKTKDEEPDKYAMVKPEWARLYQLTSHPLAATFKLLPMEQLKELADDIKKNGLRNSIVLLDGKVLDGQNRLRACELAGAVPRVTEFRDVPGNKASPIEYVISQNLRRRHMDASERALAAAAITLYQEQHVTNAANTRANLHGSIPKQTKEDAAKLLNVSERSVASARKVLTDGIPKLAAAVSSGSVAVSAAAEVASLASDQQKEIVAAGPAAISEAAKEVRAVRNNKKLITHNKQVSNVQSNTADLGNNTLHTSDAKLEHLLQQPWLPLQDVSQSEMSEHAILVALPKELPADSELNMFLDTVQKLGGRAFVTNGLKHVVTVPSSPEHVFPDCEMEKAVNVVERAHRRKRRPSRTAC